MSAIKSFARNLRLIFSRDITGQLGELESRAESRADAREKALDARVEERLVVTESRVDERLAGMDERIDAHQAAGNERLDLLDGRLEERLNAVDARLEERFGALDNQFAERFGVLDVRLDERLGMQDDRLDTHVAAVDARLEERLGTLETRTDERLATIEKQLDERFDSFESRIESQIEARLNAIDQRIEERLGAIDQRIDERLEAIETGNDRRFEAIDQHLTGRLAEIEASLDRRATNYETAVDQRLEERFSHLETDVNRQFTEHARAIDIRLDDRQVGMDRRIDERFNALEKRTDERVEMHERRTDQSLEHNRVDIIDRTDLLLQILEQRLDRQRREIRSLRRAEATPEEKAGQAPESAAAEQAAPLAPDLQLDQLSPVEQIQSFRKMAESHGDFSSPSLRHHDHSLYQQILDWKKVAEDGLNQFTPDEREIVDYLLSFLDDPDEIAYARQHLRRFLGTMQRIPPPQRSTDRLLELGSLLHLAPAIKKFCGYQEIVGADFWEGEEKVVEEILEQAGGGDRLTARLYNFNVEQDPFPFPDKSFRVVLCCELIEHLQRDPMHMLWECNRVLADDGYLLLTTPNIASCRSIEGVLIGCAPYLLSQYNLATPVDQHHREYAPYEVGIALAAAGFKVLQLDTEDVWLRSNPAILKLLQDVNLPTHLRGDNIFALAVKVGSPVERYPKELYIR